MDFWPKVSILGQKFRFLIESFDFWPKVSIFDWNFRFLTAIFDFWAKVSIFDRNFRFLTEIFDFWPKVSIFDRNFGSAILSYPGSLLSVGQSIETIMEEKPGPEDQEVGSKK